MQTYALNFYGLKRDLPIVQINSHLKVASVNLLGDVELVEKAAEKLIEKIQDIEFDYLVGPEVKVVPLLQVMSKKMSRSKYVVCRKNIVGYMTNPLRSQAESLVIDGQDADLLRNKKVIIVDDVVTSGRTIAAIDDLMQRVNAQIVSTCTVFIQGDAHSQIATNVLALQQLPLF